ATTEQAPQLVIDRPRSATAVVIGYVPDPADPDKVSKVALGTRAADGTIRFAGYADVDTAADASRVMGMRRLVVRPDYLTDKRAVPVEPTLTGDIRYAEPH